MATKKIWIPVDKNEKLKVEIVDLTHEGLGVAKVDNYPLFIENALVGEICDVQVLRAEKKFGYAKVEKYWVKSPHRVENSKDELIRTGIAPLMHLKYEQQLVFKQDQVKNALKKIAKMADVPVLETIGMKQPMHYRNKAQIPVRRVNGVLETGFYRKNSHHLIPITNFFIQDEKIDAALLILRDILRRLNLKPYNEEEHTGDIRHIIVRRGHYSHEMMVILVTRKEKFFQKELFVQLVLKQLPEVVSIIQNVNDERTNVILGNDEKTLFGKSTITDTLLGNEYEISSKSFYQVNTEMAEKLYQIGFDFADLKETDNVIDAYCGIGTIGQSIACKVKHVYGMEILPQAVLDAKKNSEKSGRTNTTYVAGNAQKVMKEWSEANIQPDVLFVDPPRKGLSEGFIKTSASMNPRKIIYISCNPSTFARDIARYKEQGYLCEKVQPVDLFPQTPHVECVGVLVRK